MSSNVSYDLIWEIARPYSSYLVKQRTAGGASFSREALNAKGTYAKSTSGFANASAVGVVGTKKGGVKIVSKTSAHGINKPGKSHSSKVLKESAEPAHAAKEAHEEIAKHNRDDLIHAAVFKSAALARARKNRKTYNSFGRR